MWPFPKKKPKFNIIVERLVDQIYALGLTDDELCDGDMKCFTHISNPVKITDYCYLIFGNSVTLIRPVDDVRKFENEIVMTNSRIYYEGTWQETIIPLLEMRLADLRKVKADKEDKRRQHLLSFGLKV